MKLWKRFAAVLLAAGMLLAMLTACGGAQEIAWKDSRTMAYLNSCGIHAGDVALKASFTVGGEENYVSYWAKDGKEYAAYYENETCSEPFMMLCKYGSNYYTGAFNGTEIQWEKSALNEKNEFQQVKKLCNIPGGAVEGQSCEVKNQKINGKWYYTETVNLGGMEYTYILDRNNVLLGLQAQISGEMYTVKFTEMKAGPADSDFPVPEVKSKV